MSKTVAVLAAAALAPGSAVAAHHYIITSTKQISPKVLRHLQGRAGATGPRGPQGTQGLAGPGGAASGIVTLVDSIRSDATTHVAPGDTGEAMAVCDGNVRGVTGGGYTATPELVVYESRVAVPEGIPDSSGDGPTPTLYPPPTGGWIVKAKNTGDATVTLDAIAYCAPSTQSGRPDTREALPTR